jgi:hypothetical protein
MNEHHSMLNSNGEGKRIRICLYVLVGTADRMMMWILNDEHSSMSMGIMMRYSLISMIDHLDCRKVAWQTDSELAGAER